MSLLACLLPLASLVRGGSKLKPGAKQPKAKAKTAVAKNKFKAKAKSSPAKPGPRAKHADLVPVKIEPGTAQAAGSEDQSKDAVKSSLSNLITRGTR